MLKRTAYILVVAMLISVGVWSEGLPLTKPDKVGLSQKRLDRITDLMVSNVEAGLTSGELALVARHGKVAYLETAGMADREKNVPIDTDTIFRIYSMSKPITSVAAMILYEEGRFFLQDPVSKFIPELGGLEVAIKGPVEGGGGVFNLPDDPDKAGPESKRTMINLKTEPSHRDMTIQDLLRHTAGLTYGFFGNTSVDKLYMQSGILVTDKDLEDLVNKLSKIPLRFHPGTQWHYSVSVDVLGRLVEVVSGQPLDEFLEERILGPLAMVDTGFYVPKEKLDRFAQMYTPDGNGGIKPAPAFQSRNFVNKPTLFSGGGGMVSTAGDYLRFCQMMLNGGQLDGARILSRKTVELMTTNNLGDIPFRSGYGFGLGFAVAEDQGRIGALGSEGEYNWGGAAGTKFWIDPEEEMIGVYMVQILPHTGLPYGNQFKLLAYQSIDD